MVQPVFGGGIRSGRAIEGHGLGSLSFFKQPAGITIGEIVAMTGAVPRGDAPLDRRHRRYRRARAARGRPT